MSLAGHLTTTLFLEQMRVSEIITWDAFVSPQLSSNAGRRGGDGGESSCRGPEGEGCIRGSTARGAGGGGVEMESDRVAPCKSVSVLQGKVLILTGDVSPVSHARVCWLYVVCISKYCDRRGCLEPLFPCREGGINSLFARRSGRIG